MLLRINIISVGDWLEQHQSVALGWEKDVLFLSSNNEEYDGEMLLGMSTPVSATNRLEIVASGDFVRGCGAGDCIYSLQSDMCECDSVINREKK